MNVEDYIERMKEATHKDIESLKEADKAKPEEVLPYRVDLYQEKMIARRDNAKKQFPHGSSAIVGTAVKAVVDGMGAEGLARAYKRAKDDSESLLARGERQRAEMRRQQYMEEKFLPAVEIVVNSTSPDELLNSKQALADLDQYVLLPGKGSGSAYTASYVRQAYGNQLGQVEGRSDDSVRSAVRRINMALDDGKTRTALGIASKLKEQVDRGEALADENDYSLMERVIAYFA